jgi:outer membrane protein TolC
VPPAPVTPGSTTGDQFASNAPLTADEAAKIALLKQPSLGAGLGAIQTQQGQTIQTASALFPQLVVGAGVDKVQALPGSIFPVNASAPNVPLPDGASAQYLFSAGGALRQLIYDFNMTRNLVRQGEALERSDKQNLTTAQLNLVLAVKTDFYNM